jgi:hypothetical protein
LTVRFTLYNRRKREEGRGKKEEGRRKREEGRGKKEEGRGKKLVVSCYLLFVICSQ